MAQYECPRGFSHVLGGICFKCNGKGTVSNKPAKPSVLWTVFDANSKDLYNIKAKTKEEAIKKAMVTFTKASVEFQSEHDMSSVDAMPSSEYWTKERLDRLSA